MARISRDILEFCIKLGKCIDCYLLDEDKPFAKLQGRGNLNVPCCLAHSYAHKNKVNEANAKKYARSSTVKRKAGECTYKDCNHRLIPQELLPRWWKRETTCGIHGGFKAFRVNREALLGFITQQCLTPLESEGMTPQNIIYYAVQGYILVGLGKPGLYHTKCFAASDLLKRYEEFRRQQSPTFSVKVSATANS